jgi:hypothetical protein
MTEAAEPFRLIDLRYAFSDDGGTLSSFETRVRIGASAFLGGEVTGDRHGVFFDTQRLELGLTEENGRYEIESSYRAPWFLLDVRGAREEREWLIESTGSVRLSNDLELLISYAEDFDDSGVTPDSVEEFARSSAILEPALPARELLSKSAGVFYQRASVLELLGEARWSRRRTEASFDLDVERYRLELLVHRSPVELDGSIAIERISDRLPRREGLANLGAEVQIGGYLLARAETFQRWEPGVLRFEERYGVGLTFFGRRHRFARSAEAAPRLLALQKKANALGYNERRRYDVGELRRFRERLGISGAHRELAKELEELYRAQVRDRNVPQLGFRFELAEDAVLGVETRSYSLLAGVPWTMRWPLSRSEASVEFLTAKLGVQEESYSGGVRAISYEVSIAAFLNREMSLRFGWERPGRTPDEIARRTRRPARFTVSYEYALGR